MTLKGLDQSICTPLFGFVLVTTSSNKPATSPMHYDLTSSSVFTSGWMSSEHQKRPYLKCQPTPQHIEPALHYSLDSLLNVEMPYFPPLLKDS